MRVQKRSDGGVAMQWRGDNLAEMRQELGGIVGLSGGNLLAVDTIAGSANKTAMVMDFVVKMNDGQVEVHTPYSFERIFYET